MPGTFLSLRAWHLSGTFPAQDLLRQAMEELRFSARGYDKILKVARTIADLAGAETIEPVHLAEALQYRSLDRQLWL